MRVKLGSVGYLKAVNAGYAIGLDEDGRRIEFLGDRRVIALAPTGAWMGGAGRGGAGRLPPLRAVTGGRLVAAGAADLPLASLRESTVRVPWQVWPRAK